MSTKPSPGLRDEYKAPIRPQIRHKIDSEKGSEKTQIKLRQVTLKRGAHNLMTTECH